MRSLLTFIEVVKPLQRPFLYKEECVKGLRILDEDDIVRTIYYSILI